MINEVEQSSKEKPTPWIRRDLGDDIYDNYLLSEEDTVHIIFVEAKAGRGKTILARDLGYRLGSVNGYEKSIRGSLIWSGILDLYDPDTNSNHGIERRLIDALADDEQDFEEYYQARKDYDQYFKKGITGVGLEDQRRRVETSFMVGLQVVANRRRPILVFDTAERLENPLDEILINLSFLDDTASLQGWLIYQFTHMSRGVVLLFGRKMDNFYRALEGAVSKANQERVKLAPIQIHRYALPDLTPEEKMEFLKNRIEIYPPLKKLLKPDVKEAIIIAIQGNPLLLDLVLQALLETANPAYIKETLQNYSGGVRALEKALVEAYMNSFKNPDRVVLLQYLALARNGIFDALIRSLDSSRAEELISELTAMENLPFIKVRQVSYATPENGGRCLHKVYFLHDAMYAICDEVLLRPQQVVEDTRKILNWYDIQINSFHRIAASSTTFMHQQIDPDLLVESLFYRMRVDPRLGYEWFLMESDTAIRTAQTGLAVRLSDAMTLFLESASPEGEPGFSVSSPIDHSAISTLMPRLFEQYELDNAILWIKRLTVRGKTADAAQVGRNTEGLSKKLYEKDKDYYRLAYAEFSLWFAQTIMYGYKIQDALQKYQNIVDLLGNWLQGKNGFSDYLPFDAWRAHLILGRALNNMGYSHWMYLGKYSLALQELKSAIQIFRLTRHKEELANSSDNMGRVHAMLGEEFQAVQLAKKGLELRHQLGKPYREALSNISLALIYIRSGKADLAMRAVEIAIDQFGKVGIERGIGLGLLTRGMIYRNMAEMLEDLNVPYEEALKFIGKAENDLREAIRIFSVIHREPIREIQANNEMACSHRARLWLFRRQSNIIDILSNDDVDVAFRQARTYYRKAIELAHKHEYDIEELDSMQDLAVLYARARQFKDAGDMLTKIRDRIPLSHKIQEGIGLVEQKFEDRVDAYYKLMGQVELLAGAIEYERDRRLSPDGMFLELPDENALIQTAYHYLLAVVYLHRFSGETHTRRVTFSRIYDRFQPYSTKLIERINQEHVETWMKQFNLLEEQVSSLRHDVFDLLE